MKVMLVDDRQLVRDGVASLLRTRKHEVVAQAGNGREALAALRSVHPDVILMDIRMPEMGGLEATRLIKAQYPDIKVVMLTVSDDERDLFEAVKSGAHSYLLKDLDAGEFFDALDSIQRNEAVVPARLAGKPLEEFRSKSTRGADAGPDGLSQREQEVLELVAQGQTNKQVAERLFITENTVKYHMKNILDKLHLQNRSQVIAWAARYSERRRASE
ncbi:MAG: response regulator transcription factor [SAR202 cluster bacterium]|nr:response regulator transcription factor [SAR202 cluster bacterium]